MLQHWTMSICPTVMAEIENGPELQHLLHCKLNPNTPITFFFLNTKSKHFLKQSLLPSWFETHCKQACIDIIYFQKCFTLWCNHSKAPSRQTLMEEENTGRSGQPWPPHIAAHTHTPAFSDNTSATFAVWPKSPLWRRPLSTI